MNLKHIFSRKQRAPDKIYAGRITRPEYSGPLYSANLRQAGLLTRLRQTYNSVDAIELLIEETGDLSQALYSFIRLSNVGHQMEFFGLDKDTRLHDVEMEWREFASRVNSLSNAGLDGLIDQFHYLAYVRGAMACEAEVARTLDDIFDVYPVNPQSIEWKLEERGGRQIWIPYQHQMRGEVSLEHANFFWVPTDPKVDDPRGRLLLKPALAAIDFQIQILNDLQKVIHNQGWPRYDIALIMEQLINNAPPDVKGDRKKLQDYIESQINYIQNLFNNLKPDDAFIHPDCIQVKNEQGNANSRSLDVRAIMETIDTQVMTSTKSPSLLMQRLHSNTETWGTVQFRVFVSGIQNIQRGSKRLVESIASLWCRTKGYQAIPVFTHNLIDYESEMQRTQIKQLKGAFFQLAQHMGWITGDEAANELFGHDAVGEPQGGDNGDQNDDDSTQDSNGDD